MRHNRGILLASCVMTFALGSPAASAQDFSTREIITTVVIALPLTTTSYAVERTINKMVDKAVDKIVTYLEEHEASVRDGLALGGGEAIEDLAELCGVPHARRPAFATRLRARRGVLEQAWGQGGVTRESGYAFLTVLVETRDEVMADGVR
jgi:hypothetical protein